MRLAHTSFSFCLQRVPSANRSPFSKTRTVSKKASRKYTHVSGGGKKLPRIFFSLDLVSQPVLSERRVNSSHHSQNEKSSVAHCSARIVIQTGVKKSVLGRDCLHGVLL